MARLRRPEPEHRPAGLPDGAVPPPELLDPAAELWSDWAAYRAYMTTRGWVREMEPRDRLRVVDPALAGSVPRPGPASDAQREGRRWRAARAWAGQAGLLTGQWDDPRLAALRELIG